MVVQFSLLSMKDQNFGENSAGILVYESFEFDFMCEAVEFAK
jgi:hypothetical protein